MMRRLTSAPKPAVRVAVIISPVRRRVDPQAVAHAVVAGEVARRLGRGDQVVGATGRRWRPAPTPRRPWRRPPRARRRPRRTRAATSGAMPSPMSSLTRPMRRPSTPSVEDVDERRRRLGDRRGVQRVVAGDDLEQQRGVGDRGGERPDLVERRGEGDEAVARHERRTWASRRPRRTAPPAGGSSRRCRSRARSARSRRPPPRRCRRASRRAPGGVVRVAGGAERRVLGRAAHGELVEVGLADDDRAGRRAAARRRWRRRAAASPRGSATSTWWGCRACRGCP